MKKQLIVLILVLMVSPNLFSEHIVIAADLWCPMNCDTKSDKPGYMVEVAKSVFKRAGHKVTYRVLPWVRAIADARKKIVNGVIGPFHGDVPGFHFPENELGLVSTNFFQLKGKSWKYTGLKSLKNMKIAVIKGYDYGKEMNEYIKKNSSPKGKVQVAFGERALQSNIKKLLSGRVSAVLESPAIFWYNVRKMKIKSMFSDAGILSKSNKSYIAFSPADPKNEEYAKILSDGIKLMRKNGELVKILRKYGLKDWRK